MKIDKVHCFFEQSGTFKNEFIKLGIPAEDYDILNDFGQTDHVIDLFDEIKKAFCYQDSIFDDIQKDDLIMAFFPCVRFEDQIQMHFRGTSYSLKNYTDEQKLLYDMKLHEELHDLYQLITMMTVQILRGGYKCIIENPYSTTHYLTKYWAIKPKLIDYNRHLKGDYYTKPTQYWFINCDPEINLLDEGIMLYPKAKISHQASMHYIGGNNRTVNRSMISKEYARRFILENILDEREESD